MTMLMTTEILETDDVPTMKYTPLVNVTNKGLVKLKVMGTCFEELTHVMGNALVAVQDTWDTDPWLTVDTAETLAAGRILLAVYENYLERYATRAAPPVVTVALSKCEALVFWKCLMLHHPPRETHPAFTALMAELHQLLS